MIKSAQPGSTLLDKHLRPLVALSQQPHSSPTTSIHRAVMASSRTIVTNQNIIASYNRGPITSIFIHPASCTATLTFVNRNNGNPADLYFGHHGTPVSGECYPTGTPAAPPLNDDNAWRGYYCKRSIRFLEHIVAHSIAAEISSR
jgi:hypothetical protein